MPADLDFNGERYIPGAAGDIAYEHWHRYAFARRLATGKRVLDAACGEGYGTALLATVAADAIGIDIDGRAIAHARAEYGGRPRLRYDEASVTALPLAEAAVDVIVSFETVEHLLASDQTRMLDEFARVLAPGGLLVLSSPNKRRYSDEAGYRNPFHLHELYRADLERLLTRQFPHRRWYHQQAAYASALWAEDCGGSADFEAWTICADTIAPPPVPDGVYYVVVAAATPGALPVPGPRLSLCSDEDDSELKRHLANAREVVRLDALLVERDAALDRQAAHVRHLEELVAERERVITERDRQLVDAAIACETSQAKQSALGRAMAKLQDDIRHLDAAIEAQERIIDYRQGFRWWLQLPGLALGRWWRGRLGR